MAFDRAVFHCARLVGPSVGGVVVADLGRRDGIFRQRFFFRRLHHRDHFAAAVARSGVKEEEEQRASGIKDGFRYIRADKPSLAMVGMIATMTIFIFPTVSVMMPLYVRDVLHFGPESSRILMASPAVGSVCRLARFPFDLRVLVPAR